ncbi:hypothetical protein Y032_0111g268 [Ancylostoma ceylanicum]|uniref:Uncharacterized protein n=1 Tax=Ancylostoma ceylanicum TaxID=53326 RepID=A0A016TEH0_9BILA|nr:hypothetical protein Y032_0111g268 [Ancylostoma ceylanicum]
MIIFVQSGTTPSSVIALMTIALLPLFIATVFPQEKFWCQGRSESGGGVFVPSPLPRHPPRLVDEDKAATMGSRLCYGGQVGRPLPCEVRALKNEAVARFDFATKLQKPKKVVKCPFGHIERGVGLSWSATRLANSKTFFLPELAMNKVTYNITQLMDKLFAATYIDH